MPRFPSGWKVDESGRKVSRSLKTKDFLSALDLFRKVGDVAEELEHHPDLHLEKWNEVRIESYSHDVGRLTERDEALAERIEALLRNEGLAAQSG